MSIDPRPHAIEIARRFDASPRDVFGQWLDADALVDWFAPDTFIGLRAECDPREGGAWHVDYRSADGRGYREYGTYLEIVPERKIVMTLTVSAGAHDTRLTELVVTVTFEPDAGGTLMRFRQTGFPDAGMRDAMAEGWSECIAKLGARLGASEGEREVAALFRRWFDASHRKDLDAAMAPIADDVTSYEHAGPLAVDDVAAMREACRRGFERAGPDFLWDVPDLQIHIAGDLAVTWGLNRMTDFRDGRVEGRMWSRGTRVFRRIDGAWKLVHQHVSFPMDPATGLARTDLLPES